MAAFERCSPERNDGWGALMGQAKARKKNGTYYGQPGYETYARAQGLGWCPTAAELQLIDVPEEYRESVRQFLAPILKRMTHRIKGGDCYETAQTLMLAANNPRVAYVEGVWTRGDVIPGQEVVSGGEDHPWLHEPLKAYTLDEIRKYEREIDSLDGLSITVPICVEGWADEYGLTWTEADEADVKPGVRGDSYEDVVMRGPAQRMREKCAERFVEPEMAA